MDFALKFPEQLGLHLKSLRKAAGLSQAELAILLGVSQSRVAAIEKDPAAVSVGQFLTILKLLNAELVIRQEDPARNHSSVVADAAESQRLTALTPLGLASYKPSHLTPEEVIRSALGKTAADIAKSQGLTALTPLGLASYKPSHLTPEEVIRSALGKTAADIAKRQVQKNTTLRPQNLPVDWKNKKPKGSW